MGSVPANIHKPTNSTCLNRCHVRAGGSPGGKQRDIDLTMENPPRTLDVHLSASGANLSCLSCHKAKNHRIAGRGNDVRETDLAKKIACADCHGAAPHRDYDLDAHTGRVDCTVYHIPRYARGPNPTETHRDARRAKSDPATLRYEPPRVFASNLVPEYLFRNGDSHFYKFGDPVQLQPNGRLLLTGPLGDIREPSAKRSLLSNPTRPGWGTIRSPGASCR
ncbi:MAG TPA: hypothetical protein PLM79_00310 [Syntrophobacteraceae bacterium]|nr:hypothetical protein [Syntrophobacteraceae bacterium]